MECPPVLQICGYKKSGKTTLMEHTISFFVQTLGIKVASLKRDAHGFDWDRPNTDTAKHRASGAGLTLIENDQQMGLLMNKPPQLELSEWISWLSQLSYYEVFLVEGYKTEDYPKIVLIRSWEDWLELRTLKQIELLLFVHEEDMLLYQQEYEGRILNGLRSDQALINRFLQQWWEGEGKNE